MNKILGYRKFISSKNGKSYCILQTSKPFTDREIEHGACGQKIEEVWLPESCHNSVNPQIVGKNAEISYTVQDGRAYIEDVKFQ